MNDPDSQIDRMLRESPPDPRPVPGLDSRICRTVRQSGNQRLNPFVPPIVGIIFATPMIALGIHILLPQSKPAAPVVVAHAADRVPTQAAAPAALIEEYNPLRGEAIAIQNDARRAGRFLLDALPSLADR